MDDHAAVFVSADAANPDAWTDVPVLASGEKHKSIFNKISTMFKNARFLYKMLGTTDISAIGDGTVTGAVNALNTDMPVFGPFRYVKLPYTAKRNCFMQVCFTCNSTASYLYLMSQKFGYPYWSWCSYESQHDAGISQIFPVCAGDTISVYMTGNINPRFKVSDVI